MARPPVGRSFSVGGHGHGNTRGRRQGGARRTTRKADHLHSWWDAVERLYGDRILPFDLQAASIAGALSDQAAAKGLHPGFADVAVAAIAEAHALVLLTRNLRHFRPICDRVIDPFEALPE